MAENRGADDVVEALGREDQREILDEDDASIRQVPRFGLFGEISVEDGCRKRIFPRSVSVKCSVQSPLPAPSSRMIAGKHMKAVPHGQRTPSQFNGEVAG